MVSWTAVAGARDYKLVRGQVDAIHASANHIDLGAVYCLAAGAEQLDSHGAEDTLIPAAGRAFFYLVEYDDSSLGTVSSDRPRVPSSGACPRAP